MELSAEYLGSEKLSVFPREIFKNPYRFLKNPEMKMCYKKSYYDFIEYSYWILWIPSNFPSWNPYFPDLSRKVEALEN